MGEKKRLLYFGFLTSLVAILLSIRLYYLQVYKGDYFAQMAMKQRSNEIALNAKRGIIFDRNLRPLTNGNTIKTLVVHKNLVINDEALYDQILYHSTLTKAELDQYIQKGKYQLLIPVIEEFNVIGDYTHLYFVDMAQRYSENNLLSHVIGYINKAENTGEAGLERTFDEFLSQTEEKSFVLEYDKSRRIILNGTETVGEVTDTNTPSGVKTTIDLLIQEIVESVMDEKEINGAIVVAEVETGKILAMASRPNFHQDNIQEYLQNRDMALYNKAIQVGYPPGSLFKIIVLQTALEDNIELEHKYTCKGYEEINGVRIKCTGVHGEITLEEAFYKSCNSVFIQIGKELGGEKIIHTAQRLGFGDRVNIGLMEEIKGNLPHDDDIKGAAIGNISIGQGKIEVTPLQITNLLMTIVNRGIQKDLYLVEGITNTKGDILKKINKEVDKIVINPEISQKLKTQLINVVQQGTGKGIDSSFFGGAGGKTGSAEAVLNGENTIHGWFAGFFPKEKSKYVITIIVENGNSGSKSAAPIFEKIAKEIDKIYPVY